MQGDDLRGRLGHHKNQTHPWLKDSGLFVGRIYVIIVPIKVKGIPDVARHAPVTVTECSDTDNFPYPEVFLH